MADDDLEHVSQHPPDRDIDQHIEQIDALRIERMDSGAVWINVYEESGDVDVHYDIYCDDSGLHIKRRDEHEHDI